MGHSLSKINLYHVGLMGLLNQTSLGTAGGSVKALAFGLGVHTNRLEFS